MTQEANMTDKPISHAIQVNSIGEQKADNTQNNHDQNMAKLAKTNLGYWLLGLGVSCIPILSKQLGLAVIKSDKAGMWWKVLGSDEVAFLAIPLIITVVYYCINRGNTGIFLKIFIPLLVIGCLFYAIFAFSYELTGNIDFMLIAWYNIVFLGFVLIMGISQFMFDIIGLK
jgi:hypothetical protein